MEEADTLKKKMIRLVFPIAFQQFMLALVGAGDAVVPGRLSPNSMSAVSLAQVTLWCITVPVGCLCAFILKIPVLGIYFVLNLVDIVKLPVLYWHYRKYGWLKNIT